MGQTTKRAMPVREDLWQPEDKILDNIIRRRLDEAESEEGSAGGSTIMGGAMVLAVLGVIIGVGTGNMAAGILVPAALGALGMGYMIATASPGRGSRHGTLSVVGGPGRLPAGYLVHHEAWDAGMAEHVQYVPESQLQAAAQLCRHYPGTVDDLLSFTGSIAAQVPPVHHATPADVERRTKDLVKIGAPILREHIAKNPPKALPDRSDKKKKK